MGFGGLGYLCGSLSFALLVTRAVTGRDVRQAGSGHATATNTFRQAGLGAGVLVAALDVGKGFLPTYLAVQYSPVDWAIPLTAALAVTGHCWPAFAGFRGGMGLATAGGTILAVYPLGFLIAAGLLIALVLAIRHSARASFFTGLLLAPVFWLFGARGEILLQALGVGIVLMLRFASDWNRKYRELWLDREVQ